MDEVFQRFITIFLHFRKGILKNRLQTKSVKQRLGSKQPETTARKLVRPQVDARSKIISKQRQKISDARVILARKQRQAPKPGRLQAQSAATATRMIGKSQKFMQTPEGLKTVKQVVKQKKKVTIKEAPKRVIQPQRKRRVDFELSDEDEDAEMADLSMLKFPPKLLRRTVHNQYAQPPMPPLPTFSRTITSDPFDCYEPYQRPSAFVVNATAPSIDVESYYESLINPPAPTRKGILRNPTGELSSSLKARLYSKPDPHQPTGLFSRDRDPDVELTEQQPGYRIVVSNLQTTVTQTDIHELFEDIGELLDARLVRPGVAEVIYKRLLDAEMAVETYHNRQLDGQPMKCLLVRPRSANKTLPTTKLTKTRDLEVDMETLHKVLFKRNV